MAPLDGPFLRPAPCWWGLGLERRGPRLGTLVDGAPRTRTGWKADSSRGGERPRAAYAETRGRAPSCSPSGVCVRKTLSQLFARMPSAAPAPVVRTAPPLAVQTPALSSVSTPIWSPHLRAPGSEAECLCRWDPLLGSSPGIQTGLGRRASPSPWQPSGSGGLGLTKDQGRAALVMGCAPGDTQPTPWNCAGGEEWREGNPPLPRVTPTASLQQRLSGGPVLRERSPKARRNVPESPRGHGSLARVWCTVFMGSGSRLLDSSRQRFGGAHVGGLGLFLTGPGNQARWPRPGQ